MVEVPRLWSSSLDVVVARDGGGGTTHAARVVSLLDDETTSSLHGLRHNVDLDINMVLVLGL